MYQLMMIKEHTLTNIIHMIIRIMIAPCTRNDTAGPGVDDPELTESTPA